MQDYIYIDRAKNMRLKAGHYTKISDKFVVHVITGYDGEGYVEMSEYKVFINEGDAVKAITEEVK